MHSVPGMVHWCSAGRQTDQIGDQAVAEQRHLVAQLLFGVIHGGIFSVCGSCDPMLWTNYGAVARGSGPRLCWTRFVGWSASASPPTPHRCRGAAPARVRSRLVSPPAEADELAAPATRRRRLSALVCKFDDVFHAPIFKLSSIPFSRRITVHLSRHG